MQIRKFMQSHYGRMIIAVILGFGLSTLFRKSCQEKKCLQFKGPSLQEIEEQTYSYKDKCYQFNPNNIKCSSTKKTVRFA
jgi:hypothetical protein